MTTVGFGGFLLYLSTQGAVPIAIRLALSLSGTLAAYSLIQSMKVSSTKLLHGSAHWLSAVGAGFSLVRTMPVLSSEAFFLGMENDLNERLIELPGSLARQHGIIVGGTGSGKTRGFFLPTAAFSRGESLFCTDPKGELWRHTSGLHARASRYAPTEPHESACFNWIPLCREARYAELCARTLIESGEDGPHRAEAVWIEAESAFLGALFAHAATLPEPTPLTAYRLFTRQKQETLLKQLRRSSSDVAREQAIIFEQTQERMRGSIVPAVAAKLQFLRDPKIAQFTSASLEVPDFGRLRRRPEAIYWCLQEHDMVRLRPLTSLFITVVFEQIARAALPDSPDAIPVRGLFDEAANTGMPQQFDTKISLSRSQGLSLWLGLQSLSQLEDRHGKAAAKTILANCATKIFLSGLDVDSAEYVSRALGQTTVVSSRRAWNLRHLLGPTGSVSYRQTEAMRPLLTPDEVRRIGSDEVLIISTNRAPVLLRKYLYQFPASSARVTALGPALASVEGERRYASQSDSQVEVPSTSNAEPPALPDGIQSDAFDNREQTNTTTNAATEKNNNSNDAIRPFRIKGPTRGSTRIRP